MKNVEDWSLAYEILRPIGWIIHRASHKHFNVYGLENVPRNEAVIFAPNHQNALSDSLAIVLSSNFQPVFLGRADIFKKKLAARFLTFFKISPVYRIRDGKESLDKNQDVFDNSVRILASRKMLCIYPEAAHVGMKSMLVHKKAIPRIVFIAAGQSNYELDIKIVPVGINYSHYYCFRRNLTVRFGEPISTKNYYQILKEEGEPKATNILRNDLLNAIRTLVVNVDDKPAYDLYEQAFEMARPLACEKIGLKCSEKYFSEAEQLITGEISDSLKDKPDEKVKLVEDSKQYKELKEKLGFSEHVLNKGQIGFWEGLKILFVFLGLLPFALYGTLANGWLFYLTRYPYRKKLKDKQFFSTFSFGLSFFLFPLWTLLHFIILLILFKNIVLALLLVLLSYPSGILAWEIGQLILRTFERLRYAKLKNIKNESFGRLLTLRAELNTFFNKILA